MSKPLTPAKLAILKFLAENGPHSRQPLMQAASVGRNAITKVIAWLEYRGLVLKGERLKNCDLCLIEITMAGRRALADMEAGNHAELPRVPAPTRNVLQGFYRPPMSGYVRNDGHRHIASRGVAC